MGQRGHEGICRRVRRRSASDTNRDGVGHCDAKLHADAYGDLHDDHADGYRDFNLNIDEHRDCDSNRDTDANRNRRCDADRHGDLDCNCDFHDDGNSKRYDIRDAVRHRDRYTDGHCHVHDDFHRNSNRDDDRNDYGDGDRNCHSDGNRKRHGDGNFNCHGDRDDNLHRYRHRNSNCHRHGDCDFNRDCYIDSDRDCYADCDRHTGTHGARSHAVEVEIWEDRGRCDEQCESDHADKPEKENGCRDRACRMEPDRRLLYVAATYDVRCGDSPESRGKMHDRGGVQAYADGRAVRQSHDSGQREQQPAERPAQGNRQVERGVQFFSHSTIF
jgi:hypothetical protein